MKKLNKLKIVKVVSVLAISSAVVIAGVSTTSKTAEETLKANVESFLYTKITTQTLTGTDQIKLTVTSTEPKTTSFVLGGFNFTFDGEITLSTTAKEITIKSVSQTKSGKTTTVNLGAGYKLTGVKGAPAVAAVAATASKQAVEAKDAQITEYKVSLPKKVKESLDGLNKDLDKIKDFTISSHKYTDTTKKIKLTFDDSDNFITEVESTENEHKIDIDLNKNIFVVVDGKTKGKKKIEKKSHREFVQYAVDKLNELKNKDRRKYDVKDDNGVFEFKGFSWKFNLKTKKITEISYNKKTKIKKEAFSGYKIDFDKTNEKILSIKKDMTPIIVVSVLLGILILPAIGYLVYKSFANKKTNK